MGTFAVMADDPYVYPGTDLLRNRLDIRAVADLDEREAALSARCRLWILLRA